MILSGKLTMAKCYSRGIYKVPEEHGGKGYTRPDQAGKSIPKEGVQHPVKAEDVSGRGNTRRKGRGTLRASRRELSMAKDHSVYEEIAEESGEVN